MGKQKAQTTQQFGDTQTSQTTTPWAPAANYQKQIASESERLYGLGPVQRTPWSQVAHFTPEQLAYQQGTNDYVNSNGVQNSLNNLNGSINRLSAPSSLSSVSQYGVPLLNGYMGTNSLADSSEASNRLMYGDTTNPYLEQNVQSALDNLSLNFKNNTLPSLRRGAALDGSFGSSRNELREAQNAAALQKQMFDTSAGMYQDDYNRMEQNRFNATQGALSQRQAQMDFINRILGQGQVSDLANQDAMLNGMNLSLKTPLALLQKQLDAGNLQYTQDQNELQDATDRWNFNQVAPWENLQRFNGVINDLTGYGGTGSGKGNQYSKTSVIGPKNNTGAMIAGLALQALGAAGAIYGANKKSGNPGEFGTAPDWTTVSPTQKDMGGGVQSAPNQLYPGQSLY